MTGRDIKNHQLQAVPPGSFQSSREDTSLKLTAPSTEVPHLHGLSQGRLPGAGGAGAGP